MFEEELHQFLVCGVALSQFDWEHTSLEQIIEFVLKVETDLFRARIKIERELSSK